jgi:hypothetical protein
MKSGGQRRGIWTLQSESQTTLVLLLQLILTCRPISKRLSGCALWPWHHPPLLLFRLCCPASLLARGEAKEAESRNFGNVERVVPGKAGFSVHMFKLTSPLFWCVRHPCICARPLNSHTVCMCACMYYCKTYGPKHTLIFHLYAIIWTLEGRSNGRLENITQWRAS